MNPISLLKHPFVVLLCATLLSLPAVVTHAEDAPALPNSIETLEHVTLEGGKIVIKVGLRQPLQTPPAGFTINTPPRIALDFPGVANALGKNNISVGEGVLRSFNVVQAGTRTRLVINLAKPSAYETQIDGKTLLITLQEGAQSTAAKGGSSLSHFAETKPGVQKHTLRGVDFRRGKNGEGRVVLDLSDANTGIDIRAQGNTVIIELLNTSTPRNLERRLDVVDFGTPVQKVDTFGQGDNVRLVIENKGLWEHSAYQTDRQFVLDVKQVIEDPNKLVQGSRGGYSGDKLSLNFQNVEVRAVLQVIADFTGFNIITSDTVTGNLTLRLKDVPWDQALDIILQSRGLSMRKSGSVVWIAPTDELATKEKLELEAKQQISELEPVRTETIRLKYQKAEAIQKILSDEKQKILSKRGSVVVDVRTNTLFVQDSATKLEEIRKLIAQIDVAVQQVLIEARIVEASDKFYKQLGARLGIHDQAGEGFPVGSANGSKVRAAIGGSIDDTGYHTGQIADAPAFTKSLGVNLPVDVLTNTGLVGSPGALSLILFKQGATRFLNLELSALQTDNKGKILSNPRVVTADQKEAVIEKGTEIPYLTASSSGATTVTFRKAVLGLKVTPQITPDDNIIMDLKVNKDSRGTDTVAGPAIDTQQITTQVLVENGGTVVIGGIYQQEEKEIRSKIPLLGDIPVVGFLFRNTDNRDEKIELLIFITPRILKDSLNIR